MDTRSVAVNAILSSSKFHQYHSMRHQLRSFKSDKKYFLENFINHLHIVNKPAHISESLLHHDHIKKTLIEEFSVKVRNC